MADARRPAAMRSSGAREAERRGAGELLVTSIDRDGTRAGFDLPLLRAMREAVNLPIIASGGAGELADFVDVFEQAGSDAALARASSLWRTRDRRCETRTRRARYSGALGKRWPSDGSRRVTRRRQVERRRTRAGGDRRCAHGRRPDAGIRQSRALEKTVATKSTWLYSRSRAELWNKGATSGNTQRVVAIAIDCDNDALLYRVIPMVRPVIPARRRVFGEVVALPGAEAAPSGARFAEAMLALASTIADRHENPPEGSYTAQLFAGGIDRIAKKIGEEATEVVIAAKNEDRGELDLGDERLALSHDGDARRTQGDAR